MKVITIILLLSTWFGISQRAQAQTFRVDSTAQETTLTYIKAPVSIIRDKPGSAGQRTGIVRQYDKVWIIGKLKGRYCEIVWEGGKGFVYYKHLNIPVNLKEKKKESPVKTPRKYFLGPREGCYYITPAGNKQYVHPKHCR